jgi:cyclophilin family peptidyl-prolyl cis-trans isomerase
LQVDSYVRNVIQGLPHESQLEFGLHIDGEMSLYLDGTTFEIGYAYPEENSNNSDFFIFTAQIEIADQLLNLEKITNWILETQPIFGGIRITSKEDGFSISLHTELVFNINNLARDKENTSIALDALNWSQSISYQEWQEYASEPH